MVNKPKRLILNKATTIASQSGYHDQEVDVEYLETLRTDLNLNMKEIDNILDKVEGWYSNHRRSGGTHEFTRTDYFRIKDLLEVEYIRDLVGISENEISRSLDNSRG